MLGKKKKYIQFTIPCLKDWERLNVDIKMNRQKFRKHFVDIIEENKKGILQKKEKDQSVGQSDMDENFEQALKVEQQRAQRGLTDTDWQPVPNDRTTKEQFFLESLW